MVEIFLQDDLEISVTPLLTRSRAFDGHPTIRRICTEKVPKHDNESHAN
ncbi:1751_t:CDS:2 [Gigaspora rosea]|nr:1751_t:CDS:2 [Gigaspora rosea]